MGRIIIVLDENCRMPDGNPFVVLVHTLDDESDAYKKCIFLIGKMCKKDSSSKYFANHKYEEYLKNGNFDKASMEEVLKAVHYVDSSVTKFFSEVLR